MCCTVLYFCPWTGFTVDPQLSAALSGTPGVSQCYSPCGTHLTLLVLWLSGAFLVLHSMGRREAILLYNKTLLEVNNFSIGSYNLLLLILI